MNIVLLQSTLSDEDINKLIKEFPQYLFLAPSNRNTSKLGPSEWDKVEILFGNKLTRTQLNQAQHLRWIHSPIPNITNLCISDIHKKESIILSATREENVQQISEYALAGALAFAKNLFHWDEVDRNNPTILWDSQWRNSMWKLSDKTFLQIGLGKVGSAIAARAQANDITVHGMQDRKSFHPNCTKTYSYTQLHDVLPHVDIVSIALPRSQQKAKWFGKRELELMKNDSILIVFGGKQLIDEQALADVAVITNKFRGVLVDAFYEAPIPPSSPIWKVPNLIVTPEVAPRPKTTDNEGFHEFRFNLRQYSRGNFTDMKNIRKLEE